MSAIFKKFGRSLERSGVRRGVCPRPVGENPTLQYKIYRITFIIDKFVYSGASSKLNYALSNYSTGVALSPTRTLTYLGQGRSYATYSKAAVQLSEKNNFKLNS